MTSATHTVLIPEAARSRIAGYLADLCGGVVAPGGRLRAALGQRPPAALSERELLDELLNTKLAQIFAESAVAGDGTDWNPTELGILGDVSVSVPVTVFDNGAHQSPLPHAEPFPATLIFTPGALLRNGRGCPPADWAEVTDAAGRLCPEGYFALYERRLLPVFRHVQEIAAACGRSALVTVPGLGCGQFAGPFSGSLGAALEVVLERFLETHGASFPALRAVYFDPYGECANRLREIAGVSLLVRPLLRGNQSKPQLCPPQAYAEDGDEFSACMLVSLVAWDHVSWPGNDFFGGSRCTDDGVKAAATNSMEVLTGVSGRYDPARAAYLPPPPFRNWEEVVTRNRLRL